jgi:LemA family protein
MWLMWKKWWPIVLAVLVIGIVGRSYYVMYAQAQDIKHAWVEVMKQYGQRSALVSDLSNVVKTYAGPEEDILFKLSDVQSRAVRMNLNLEEAANPAKLKRFQEVQGELSGILTQMTLISDHYPLLAESLDYQRLTTRLEEAENRINQARNNYIQAVRTYNATLRRFPQSMTAKLFGQYVRANFSIENEREISNAQRVQF